MDTLVLSSDSHLVRLLSLLLSDFGVTIEACVDSGAAEELLSRRKFAGVFVDCEVDGAEGVLTALQRSRPKQRSVGIAILNELMSVASAFHLGANFVLYKPVTVERARRSLRAVYGMMVRERREHLRHTVQGSVYVTGGGAKDLCAAIEDVSQGGMAISGLASPALQHTLHVRFLLPGMVTAIEADGEITWADRRGRAGLQFNAMDTASRKRLDSWLAERANADMSESLEIAEPDGIEVVATEGVEPGQQAAVRTRRAIRGFFQAPVVIVATVRGGTPVVIRGRCVDITEYGLGAELEGELLVGDPVITEISVAKSKERLSVHAEVRHRSGTNYGFQFIALSQENRQVLRRLYETLPAKE